MQYLNNDRKLGLSGLMRVKNDAETLAQSIDSCIDALDELIITYHECTDGSVQIIENKKLQYPNKILVIPYPYHVIGVGATQEEYEYAKTLPIGHPQLLATYYNNALQYVNYKYVMKIDADQIYFSEDLKELRDSIVNGVHQNRLARLCGKVVNVFCQKRGNKRIWSKWHLVHWLQYIVVPLFRKQYMDYAVSELLKGNGYLSLSGVNVLRYKGQWFAPLGYKFAESSFRYERIPDDMVWPYNGLGDHLVFEANEKTDFYPLDFQIPLTLDKRVLIECFRCPQGNRYILGLYWFHFKPMREISNNQNILYYLKEHSVTLVPIGQLGRVSFGHFMKFLDETREDYYIKRNYYNFVHNLGKREVRIYSGLLKRINYGKAS